MDDTARAAAMMALNVAGISPAQSVGEDGFVGIRRDDDGSWSLVRGLISDTESITIHSTLSSYAEAEDAYFAWWRAGFPPAPPPDVN